MGSPPPQGKNWLPQELWSNCVCLAQLLGKWALHGRSVVTPGDRKYLCTGTGHAGQESHPPAPHSAVQFRHASSSTKNTPRSGRAFQELKQNRKLVNAPWLVYTHLSYYAVKPQLQVIIKELVKKQRNECEDNISVKAYNQTQYKE